MAKTFSIGAEVDLNLFTKTEAKLEALQLALNPKAILDEAGAFFINRIRTRYLAEIAPNGVPWKPSRAAIRRRAKGGTGTLFDTGRLFRSIQLSAESSDSERRIHTDVDYVLHLHDTWPFMGLSNEDITIYNKLLQLRVQKAMET